ncbi:MAG TPA: hypothetical protein VFW78_11305 [Bacteroidia bacterium]|nr:hypothetical protein [Bacteroidia bacterium]
MKKTVLFTLLILIRPLTGFSVDPDFWPKEIPAEKGGIITLYQPTLEELKGNILTGRSAVSYKKSAKEEPTFGVIWFTATLETDKDNRMASLQQFKITNSKFATDATPEQLASLSKTIETEVLKWDIDISLDQVLTSLESNKNLNDPYLKNDPPEIIYMNKPATLVTIDGDPIIKMDDKMGMERVVNTSFLIAKVDGRFYTYASGLWYESKDPLSGQEYVKSIPSKLEPVHKQIQESEKQNNDGKTLERPEVPPEVIVRTKPAELLQTDGEAQYAAVEGTSLLYVTNTLDDIFKDVGTQRTFVLLSGRWFSATSLKGPWTYVPANELPADFAKIPAGSEKDGVLVSVAGTAEAEEAKTEAQIPQTAKVDRSTAKVDVQFDGTPKFTPIDNTSLKVAENSSVTVIQTADGRYFACDNGIWYVSNVATGPYSVSNERPSDLEKIPPDNPAYNTKYVYIYDSTPQYVYVGYTPGYMGTYVYGPTVVYGTGYYYRPWYGVYYYPRPVTYGFGMSYNPWTGWSMSFGMSFNTGWYGYGGVHVGIHFGGYWGGCGYYRPPYRGWGYNGGYYGPRGGPNRINSPNINVNRPVNINTGDININRNHTNNVYNKVDGARSRDINRTPDRGTSGGKPSTSRPKPSTGQTPRPAAPVASDKANNIYAGRDGNVYQRDNNGNVQQRDNNQWKPANNPSQSRSNIDRSQQQRDRGQTRDMNFNQQHPSRSTPTPSARPAGGSRPAGGARPAGGGRRR